MALNVTQQLIKAHLVEGQMNPGEEIGLTIDQTLTQDATGTLVMLELESMGLEKVKTEVSVQYVDHNLLQTDYRNPDDHVFLQSACKKFGIWFSRAGNGVSHPVHMERFGIPGKTLAGSDSHTPAAGGLGMLAFGAGGMDVALAMAGEPMRIQMPKILGVKLTGTLSDWVSAKDVVLTMLEKYDVKGCKNKIIEYYGPGLDALSAMDRHVLANMGTEMGATSTVFPSDEETRRYLKAQEREKDWIEIKAEEGCEYDEYHEIDLSAIEPKIALPSSPGKVRKVREVEGKPIYQAVIGSSANPGLRDFWITAEMVDGKQTHDQVSFDINPTSRQVIENLGKMGGFLKLIHAGARFHQSGCLGCIGMGQAPASNQISLRTMPRNFPGRSGTDDDLVYLCSPETATASALTGKITDPRDMENLYDMKYPKYKRPEKEIINRMLLVSPDGKSDESHLKKGPNIKSLPTFDKMKDEYQLPVILKMNDNISTDEILKAGADVLPYRSNVPKISEYAYSVIDKEFDGKARQAQQDYGGHIVVAGENYAQGSSREHAALSVKYLGQVAVLAKSYARIGWQNLINYGVLPLEFINMDDYDKIEAEDMIRLLNIREQLIDSNELEVENTSNGQTYKVTTGLSQRQKDIILAGGIVNYIKEHN
ncbi:MAG: aconitate hydratase [Bacteroidetes bacterium]|jgi:aconitate hydratase|nr:aconitate hydratase [Bacteroidota bacterium]